MTPIPKIGLGTWQLFDKACVQAVKMALEIGYRHIDTAFAYENHAEIAKAMKGYPRESLFLTSKFGVEMTEKKSVEEICDLALKGLKTDYLDLFLIHWPDRDYPLVAILEELHALCEKGKIRFPGVSNYTIHHLQDAYDAGLSVPYNQVEFHPYLDQKELLDFSRKHGTELIAHRPFGKGQLLMDEPLFGEIGKKHGKSASQVILRWINQKGLPVVPKATTEEHLKENLAIFDFALSEGEMKQLDGFNKNFRYCLPDSDVFNY